MHIIDRRLNPGGKSLQNRQRFLRRAKALVRQAVRDLAVQRSIKDAEQGAEVTIPAGGVREPGFRHGAGGGSREQVLPGNREYQEGDLVPRPPRGGSGGGSEGSDDGKGEDAFQFALSGEEFMDLFLEDLELPDLAKRRLVGTDSVSWERAGYSVSGSPANLALPRTMRNSLSRRIALRRPKPHEIARLKAEIEALEQEDDEAATGELRDRLALQIRRSQLIPYIDPLDVRYKRFTAVPKPIARAVMFCLMDVSGSMTEHMKDLAKRFYMLLYIFLRRRYRQVEIVFIRHTHEAQEVDEEQFFYSRESGGTVVSTALEEMIEVVRKRYPADEWNIYAAQASDGDNTSSDNAKTAALLTGEVLPLCQYYAYLEVGPDSEIPSMGFTERDSSLWRTYRMIEKTKAPFAMRKVRHRRDIYPVFRELFQRRVESAKAGDA